MSTPKPAVDGLETLKKLHFELEREASSYSAGYRQAEANAAWLIQKRIAALITEYTEHPYNPIYYDLGLPYPECLEPPRRRK